MTDTLTSISFVDLYEPEDGLCELLYMGLLDSISSYTALYGSALGSGSEDDDIDTMVNILEAIHVYVDVLLQSLTSLYDSANCVHYLVTHDGSSFVFSPGNIFTANVARKMDMLQTEPIIRFNTRV